MHFDGLDMTKLCFKLFVTSHKVCDNSKNGLYDVTAVTRTNIALSPSKFVVRPRMGFVFPFFLFKIFEFPINKDQ